MLNLDNLEKFKTEDARELLATANKKLWDDVVQEEILKFAKEKNLTIEQTENLRKRKMLELYYADLQGKNIANEKSNDMLAKRAIRRNKDKMYQANELYKQLGSKVKGFGQEFDNRLNNKIEKEQNKKKNAGK